MGLYKVIFENNVAVTSESVVTFLNDGLEVQDTERGNVLKWFVIFAWNEKESFTIAKNAFKYYNEHFRFVKGTQFAMN